MTLDSYLTRSQYEPGEKPFVYYAIFGFSGDLSVYKTEYRITEIPEGLNFNSLSASEQSEYYNRFFEGAIGAILKNRDVELAQKVQSSEKCLILSGTIENDQDLLYIQNITGIVQNFLDDGAIAVLDVLTLNWIKPDEWRDQFYAVEKFSPFPHIQVFQSHKETNDNLTLHTRGMRKFGRSDIRILNVPPDQLPMASSLLNHLVILQVDGAIVPDNMAIDVEEFPGEMVTANRGGYDDVEFNNYFIEITWNTGDLSLSEEEKEEVE